MCWWILMLIAAGFTNRMDSHIHDIAYVEC